MKRKLIQTDILGLYVEMRKPRRWRYLLADVHLFLGIVWRPWESGRMDWRTAWDVAFGHSLYQNARRAWEAHR